MRSPSPSQEAMKKIVLLKALGRERKWTVKGLALLWDNFFWSGRQATKDNLDKSVKGVIGLRKLYKTLPEKGQAYSCKSLCASIDAGTEISSVGDFFFILPKSIEIWINGQYRPSDIRKSILPAAERYVLERSLRHVNLGGTLPLSCSKSQAERRIDLVFYYGTEKRMTPLKMRVKCPQNDKAVVSLITMMEKKISFPCQGPHCNQCDLQC